MALIDSLVSYWKFDVNSATQTDSHGSNDGTVSGATYTASGLINGGYDFDGTNDKITVADDNSLDFTSAFSISAWVKFDVAGTFKHILSKHNVVNDNGYALFMHSDNTIRFQAGDGTSWGSLAVASTAHSDTGVWHHVVATFGSGTGRIYINGSADGTDTSAAIEANTEDVWIGRDVNNDTASWNGVIDELGVWSKELSSSEVTELYNSGSGLAYPFSTDSLTITAPNGAEDWDRGDSENITWTDVGTIANVKIELSTNNGSTYSTIVASTTNDGTYAWTIPDEDSSNCLIRISDVLDSDVNDVSNAVFTISPATITITAPNGAEDWDAGTSQNITWTNTGTFANVLIEVSSDNGSSYSNIVASTANDGTYAWTVHDVNSTQNLVRISDAADVDTIDVSNAVFTTNYTGWISPGRTPYPNRDPTKTKGTGEIARRDPVTTGLIAKTTKQEGRSSYLISEKGSKVRSKKLKGIR